MEQLILSNLYLTPEAFDLLINNNISNEDAQDIIN